MSTSSVTYRHTKDMPEISGFGGGYEKMCQNMLEAGCNLLLVDEPNLNPRYRGFKDVFGIAIDDNEDAKRLDEVVTAACPDCTGAMHQAVVSRLLYIKEHGWDAYCQALREKKAEVA